VCDGSPGQWQRAEKDSTNVGRQHEEEDRPAMAAKRKAKAKRQKHKGGKFVKKDPLPSNFPQLNPQQPLPKQKPTRKRLPRNCEGMIRQKPFVSNAISTRVTYNLKRRPTNYYAKTAWFDGDDDAEDSNPFEGPVGADIEEAAKQDMEAATWEVFCKDLMSNDGPNWSKADEGSPRRTERCRREMPRKISRTNQRS
jgi:hypothetical protein